MSGCFCQLSVYSFIFSSVVKHTVENPWWVVLDSVAVPQAAGHWLAISPRVVRVGTAFSHTPVSLSARQLLTAVVTSVVTSGSLGITSAADIRTGVSFVEERRTPIPPLLAGGRTELSWGCESLLVSVLNSVERFDARAAVELLSQSELDVLVEVGFGTCSSCSTAAPEEPAEHEPVRTLAAWLSTINKLLLLLLLLFGCWGGGGLATRDLMVASSGLSAARSWLLFGRWWITTATVLTCFNPDWSLVKSSLVEGSFAGLWAAACQLFEQRSAGMLQTRTQRRLGHSR